MGRKSESETKINREHFIGKTIKEVDFEMANYIVFYFTDGSKAELQASSLYWIEEVTS